ncbi:hypothetical protein MATL_G00207780 [Megalops atlanticus]|uniref:BTB domain-containing protein n=1 Tax=Megalops atlanticus TaxID=7932 RepID=A0A9D3SY75_MEGAT|nr:hypothetical protein MATL_G00207780 [Megalops atlanticus]
MGVSASSYPNSCSPRFGGSSPAQHTLIGTTSYAQQGYGCESKLYSLEQGPEKPQDKKKKSSGLATLKRKFIKRRKSSRSADHARQMRELLSGWDVRDVNALVEEYEGTAALKELSLRAGLARPEARTLRRDLAALYEQRLCADAQLLFQGARFPVHRAVLAARCPLFKKLLPPAERGADILMDGGVAGVDAPMFDALLRYLYTGELGVAGERADILARLGEEFGTPSPLEADMRALCEHTCYYDSVLGFSSDGELAEGAGAGGGCAGGAAGQAPPPAEEELRAHKALLSARSPFFRNLLQRRIRAGEEPADRGPHAPTRIVLDESIIPKKYARVILHCMYTDAVDLSLVLRSSASAGSLGEVQALVAGKGSMTRTEEAMELYHIALFLEFSMLAQGCEDIVVESISLESVVPILRWSSQPYGSKWVHRQAVHFLCEEFSHIVTSDVLYELSKEHLLTAIQSDYLQASEQDILKYVVKWGEQQLIRRMAEREPNLLSGTAHSVNKRGVKRRDLDLEELKEILSPLLPCVRIEHILPANSEVLSDAMKRGLISTPPLDMLPTAEGGKANAWLRLKSAGIYVRPRLFSPYVEEAKAVLDEMMVEQTELVRLRMVRMSNVPDTLYMVTNTVPQCCHMINHQQMAGGQAAPPSVVANEIPVPRLAVVKEMTRRLQALRHTEQVQRAYALNCGEGATVSYELQIRVLREFGLPDGAAELLQNPHKFFPEERFGDESPVLALRQAGWCRVDSAPPAVEGAASFHPPLPPPPPPYHPPSTPGHAHAKAGWRPRAPPQPPSRSVSYPCNQSLLPWRPSPKQDSPAYPPGMKTLPPDCTNPQGVAHAMYPGPKGSMEPAMSELMPDIAVGVSAMSLREHRAPQRHATDPETRPDFPDLYDFPVAPAPGHHAPSQLQPPHVGPDLHNHGRTHPRPPPGRPLDLAPAEPPPAGGLAARGRSKVETDLTCGLGPPRPPSATTEPQEERPPGRRVAADGTGGPGEPHRSTAAEEIAASRDRRSPNKPEYLYRKSAL